MEQYEVKITEPAQRQLQEIVRYIAEDLQEKRTAIRMLDTLEKEILSLSTLPNRVALTEEEPWHSAGIRKMPVKNYLVYFWVNVWSAGSEGRTAKYEVRIDICPCWTMPSQGDKFTF